LARVEPDTVSLTAFNHLTLRIFLQGVSLAAKLRFVSLINSLAETLRPFKTKIFVLEEADKTQEYWRISSFEANYYQKFCFEGVTGSALANL